MRWNLFKKAMVRLAAGISLLSVVAWGEEEKGDRVVVLTFDDAVKSQRTFVAPLLKEYGFGATFFVTHKWMDDPEHFMTWQEIAEIYQMGFEIGNHTWTHDDVSTPKGASRLQGQLALVDYELRRVKVPKPISFAYPGNGFGPEAFEKLRSLGYRFARRGMQPEVPYGRRLPGPLYDPTTHHPLLIPTSGDAYPNWELPHFQEVVDRAEKGKIVVLQFHGVPDLVHPWVNTPPERFKEYMAYLKEKGFRVIALRDVESMAPFNVPNQDPMIGVRHPDRKEADLPLATEAAQTRENLNAWLDNMILYHHYSWAEVAQVIGFNEDQIQPDIRQAYAERPAPQRTPGRVQVMPYPGGRHPRISFLDGANDPLRGSKASIFLPWDTSSYIVVDLPEAVWCQWGLLFLVHSHIPTYWDKQNIWMENRDWKRASDGSLVNTWELPNGTSIGAKVMPQPESVEMELWLRNGGAEKLTGLLNQVCVMLKGAPDFNEQTIENKILDNPFAGVHNREGNRWILTAWEGCKRPWANPQPPCFHADPQFPDCEPGETVKLRGRIWFYEGQDPKQELEKTLAAIPWLERP